MCLCICIWRLKQTRKSLFQLDFCADLIQSTKKILKYLYSIQWSIWFKNWSFNMGSVRITTAPCTKNDIEPTGPKCKSHKIAGILTILTGIFFTSGMNRKNQYIYIYTHILNVNRFYLRKFMLNVTLIKWKMPIWCFVPERLKPIFVIKSSNTQMAMSQKSRDREKCLSFPTKNKKISRCHIVSRDYPLILTFQQIPCNQKVKPP